MAIVGDGGSSSPELAPRIGVTGSGPPSTAPAAPAAADMSPTRPHRPALGPSPLRRAGTPPKGGTAGAAGEENSPL